MTLRNIMEKLKTVLFLVFRLLRGVPSFFIVLWKMELSSNVSRSLRSFKEVLMRKKFLDVDLMSYSYGIVSVIILLLLLGIFQTDKLVNTQEKTRNGTLVSTYLRLTLPTLKVIYQTRIIQRFRTSINVLTSQLSMMGTMQHNLTIDAFGTYHHSQ